MKREKWFHMHKKMEKCFIKDLLIFYWTHNELINRCQDQKKGHGRQKLEQDRYDLMMSMFVFFCFLLKYIIDYIFYIILLKKIIYIILNIFFPECYDRYLIRRGIITNEQKKPFMAAAKVAITEKLKYERNLERANHEE